METIDTPQLRALIEAGAVEEVEVTGTPGGFRVRINNTLELQTQRGKPRSFMSCAALIRYMKQTGINRFVMDVKGIENDDYS